MKYSIPRFILKHPMGSSGQLTFQNACKHPNLMHGHECVSRENPWKVIFAQVAKKKQKQPRKRKRDDARSSCN
eukprot:5927521-Karenia_brevis.AAC.1